MNRQQIEQQLLARAREDATFRKMLLTNPHAALQQETGVEIPPGMELRVLEETPQRLCLVLPLPEDELSDLELASVAGGAGGRGINGAGLSLTLGVDPNTPGVNSEVTSSMGSSRGSGSATPSPAAPAAPSGGK